MSEVSWDRLMSAAQTAVASFNFFEALFWLAVSAGFLYTLLRFACKSVRVWTLAMLLLAFFGVSDFFEVRTGAWWRP